MELYLIKDQTVKFKKEVYDRGEDYIVKSSEYIPVVLEPVTDECEHSKEYCKLIAKALNESTNKVKSESGKQENSKINSPLEALVTIPTFTSDHGCLNIFYWEGEDGACVFEQLVRVFKRENLRFNLTIKDLNITYSCGCKKLVNAQANDMPIETWENYPSFDKIKFPVHECVTPATLDGEKTSRCRLTVTVILNESALTNLSQDCLPMNPLAVKYKMLLDEALASDLVVVAANGVEVKCHKGILMVNCDVFRGMFERSKMKEETTNRLEMQDMSEDGVHAFLNFIYWSDVKGAREKCDVALELFRAGDKYGISSLKTAMKTLICSKGPEWFNVDMAVRLSLLVQNFEEKEEITKKVAQVLKWYSRNSYAELVASEEYQNMFRNDPQVAMTLFSRFLEFVYSYVVCRYFIKNFFGVG